VRKVDLPRQLFDRAGDLTPRDEILGSWRRSVHAGLSPQRLEVPFDGDVDGRGRLAWAAESVLDRVGADLEGTRIGLLLTDAQGLVVTRRASDTSTLDLLDEIRLAPGFMYGEAAVGTNAIGTALQNRAPTVVQAQEHFADALTQMSCAAVTINDPRTGRLLGVVDLSCEVGDASTLMLPLAKRAAWEIEQRLLDDASTRERVLHQQFLRARRTIRGPLIALNEQTLLVNTAAANILDASDHARLWDCALQVLGSHGAMVTFATSGGHALSLRCEPVMDGAYPRRHGAVRDANCSEDDLAGLRLGQPDRGRARRRSKDQQRHDEPRSRGQPLSLAAHHRLPSSQAVPQA